jgi:predicted extracellular nuclease
MPNPQDLVISTELYDTLKNDDFNNSIQIIVPSGVSVPASGLYLNTTVVEIGSAQSIAESRVQTSSNTSLDYILTSPYSAGDTVGVNGFSRTGNLGAYQIYCGVTHTKLTEITARVFIVNPYGSTLTGQSGAETFTFKIRTYRAPF